MAYSAYHPQASHSEALRPTNFQSNTSYEPVYENEAPSPVDTRSNPFVSQHDYSSDHVNQPYYGAGTGGHGGDMGYRAYGDDIPLREHPSNVSYDPPPPPLKDGGSIKKEPMVAESAMSQDELAREERRRRRKRRQEREAQKGLLGVGTGRIPWVVYTFTLIQITVFIAEIVKNSILTGTPIEIHPTFNIMIGPSPYVLINMGSRFLSCMKDETASGVTPSLQWTCPNSTSLDPTDPHNHCTIAELCGNGAAPSDFPVMQWWRFISPIFLHVGLIHIGFNMLLQLTLGREIEKIIGSIRFFFLYMASGIFGFILGGNFAAKGLSSMGASGSLFGILGISLLDLLYTWGQRRNPGKELAFIGLDIVISLVLGLLPGLDNFSHIGGLLMGLVLGICILRSPDALRKRVMTSYKPHERDERSVDRHGRTRAQATDYSEFTKGPIGFFRARNPWWWAWWLVRAGTLIAVIVAFIVLLNNFYIYNNQCSWCKYLSCLPITTNGVNWCDIGSVIVQNSTDPKNQNPFKRGITEIDTFGYL